MGRARDRLSNLHEPRRWIRARVGQSDRREQHGLGIQAILEHGGGQRFAGITIEFRAGPMCSAGEPCAPEDPCQVGITVCGPTRECMVTGTLEPGTECGAGRVCDAEGVCGRQE